MEQQDRLSMRRFFLIISFVFVFKLTIFQKPQYLLKFFAFQNHSAKAIESFYLEYASNQSVSTENTQQLIPYYLNKASDTRQDCLI